MKYLTSVQYVLRLSMDSDSYPTVQVPLLQGYKCVKQNIKFKSNQ